MAEERQNALNGTNTFKAFGLTIASTLQCPELLPGAGAADVAVLYGEVPWDLPGATRNGVRFQALRGQLLLQVDRIARFLVRDGNEIVIERHAEACDDDVRLFLLGPAFGALLHQRGLLVLQGSTVKVDEGCVVFLGKSGTGKSTLATMLHQRGYSCLGDEICAVSIGEDGVPYAAPAYPQANLWIDSLRHFGIDPKKLRRVRPCLNKRALPLERYCGEDRTPVTRLYVLNRSPKKAELELMPVTGPEKIKILRHHTYRFEYLQGLDLAASHFRQLSCLASGVPVKRIVRPAMSFAVEQTASAVEGDFRS